MLQSTTAAAAASGDGSLVIIGGGLGKQNQAVYDEIIDLGGGPSDANVVIVPAGSGTPATSGDSYEQDFVNYGVPEENVTVVPLAVKDDPDTATDESQWADNVDNASVADRIDEATVVFYTGGAQNRVTSLLLDDGSETLAAQAIRGVYSDGGVIAGTSAGAAIMSDDMVGAGTSYGATVDGVSYTDTYDSTTDNRVWMTRGMGYLDHGIVDQHFHSRARIGRLVRAMHHRNADRGFERQTLGYGIGENTSLVFEGGTTTARVVGENGVTVADLSGATATTTGDAGALELTGVEVSYLTDGDSYDYAADTFRVATEKQTDTVENPYYDGNRERTRVLENAETVALMTEDLVDSTATTSSGIEWGDGDTMWDGRTQAVALEYFETAETEGYWGRYDDGVGRYTALRVGLDVLIES